MYVDVEENNNYIIADFAVLTTGDKTFSPVPSNTTFTSRASTATYFDETGTLQTAAVDEARDNNHAYIDGAWVKTGLVVEEERTNRVDNINYTSGWSQGYTGTMNISPGTGFGGTNEAQVNKTNSVNNQQLRLNVNVDSGINTLSFYLRKGDEFFRLEFLGGTNGGQSKLDAALGE